MDCRPDRLAESPEVQAQEQTQGQVQSQAQSSKSESACEQFVVSVRCTDLQQNKNSRLHVRLVVKDSSGPEGKVMLPPGPLSS